MNYKKGFTLIELLVVISIISLLSSVVLAALNETRQKAQISKFAQEISNIRNAVELYKTNNNGAYPTMDSNGVSLNTLIDVLYQNNLYGSDSISLPNGVPAPDVYPIIYQGDILSCGSTESSSGEWVIAINFNSDPIIQIPNFSELYSNGSPVPNLYCMEI